MIKLTILIKFCQINVKMLIIKSVIIYLIIHLKNNMKLKMISRNRRWADKTVTANLMERQASIARKPIRIA